ncbi:coiled-coil domain-containing protein 63-like [Epargyreus clarus]|uniref:coiled-coil domain-containing protein 63-like n=1 Tax=Epargyreus clarus TaxID=520877 RepID=UPI003C2E0A4E
MEGPTEHQSDLEVSKKMEDEHLRLQRQVRMIQIDRKQRIMGVHPQFRRQDNLLRTLKKDYINMVKDLKVAKAHKKDDKKMRTDLKKNILLRKKMEFDCEGGLTLMDQLDGLLQKNNRETLELRNNVNSTAGELEERRLLSERRLTSTENKLEVATKRFNALQSENKKIRAEIEHMLKDRAIFNQAWTKMLNALHKGKKFLTDLFESSTLAYDQRDEWCTKLRSIQEKGKMDQMLQIQEMRDLQKAFDHEMKLYYFLGKKGVHRINKKQEEKEEEQKRRDEENVKQELDALLKIIEEINDYTQEPEISKIIETFERVEQSNFSMYRLLTDLCAENEVLGADLRNIRLNIDDRRDWNEMMENNKCEKIKKLKDTLEIQKEVTADLRRREEEKDRLIKDTMEKVEEMFKMLDCSIEPYQNLLGDKNVSIHNLNLTFCLITEKIKELVQIAYYYERQVQRIKDKTSTSRLKKYTIHNETQGHFTPRPINVLVPTEPCPSCVEARWMSRVTDTPEVPFDRTMALNAVAELAEDPAFERCDRIHPLTECRVPHSRVILARRYMNC